MSDQVPDPMPQTEKEWDELQKAVVDPNENHKRGTWSGLLSFDKLALVAVPVLVFVGCGLAGFGDTAGEVLSTVGADAVGTMPDPSTVGQPGGITPTQFWATWGATMAMHEGRKLIRLFIKKKF